MRAALLFGARPRPARLGPSVEVEKGRWRVVVDGLIDSLMDVHFGPLPSPLTCDVRTCPVVDGPTVACVEIVEPGSEEFLSVYLERL